MPRYKYKVRQSWSEIYYYHNTVYVEADSEEEARRIAEEDQDLDDSDNYDTEYNDGSFSVDEVEEYELLEDEDEEESSEPEPKIKRKLPNWF